jgi:hypothetical protein
MLFNVGPATARELIETNSTKWLTWDEMADASDMHAAEPEPSEPQPSEHVV